MHKFKKGMNVIVITGKYKSKQGKILRFDPEKNRVIVEGINIVKKATRPSQQNPTGGFVEREASLHISNIAGIDPDSKRATRIGFEMAGDRKIRISRSRCGQVQASGKSVE